jgi:hypothetical protein
LNFAGRKWNDATSKGSSYWSNNGKNKKRLPSRNVFRRSSRLLRLSTRKSNFYRRLGKSSKWKRCSLRRS